MVDPWLCILHLGVQLPLGLYLALIHGRIQNHLTLLGFYLTPWKTSIMPYKPFKIMGFAAHTCHCHVRSEESFMTGALTMWLHISLSSHSRSLFNTLSPPLLFSHSVCVSVVVHLLAKLLPHSRWTVWINKCKALILSLSFPPLWLSAATWKLSHELTLPSDSFLSGLAAEQIQSCLKVKKLKSPELPPVSLSVQWQEWTKKGEEKQNKTKTGGNWSACKCRLMFLATRARTRRGELCLFWSAQADSLIQNIQQYRMAGKGCSSFEQFAFTN